MKLQYEQLQNEYTRYVKSVNAAEELCSDWRQSSCAAKCKRIIKRRKEDELNKCFKCPYPNCKKDYASTLALSLHIKNKHNGGSKRDRDRAAVSLSLT